MKGSLGVTWGMEFINEGSLIGFKPWYFTIRISLSNVFNTEIEE